MSSLIASCIGVDPDLAWPCWFPDPETLARAILSSPPHRDAEVIVPEFLFPAIQFAGQCCQVTNARSASWLPIHPTAVIALAILDDPRSPRSDRDSATAALLILATSIHESLGFRRRRDCALLDVEFSPSQLSPGDSAIEVLRDSGRGNKSVLGSRSISPENRDSSKDFSQKYVVSRPRIAQELFDAKLPEIVE